MFDSSDDQVKEKVSPRSGWARAFGACLGVFLVSAIYTMTNYFDAKKDAEIAPRQQTAMGVVTAKVTGKNGSIYFKFPYSSDHIFPYHEVYYTDSESGNNGFSVGQQVRVYFDPSNPWTGSLSDFHESSEKHQRYWKLWLAASIVSGSFAGFCWPRFRRRDNDADESAPDQ